MQHQDDRATTKPVVRRSFVVIVNYNSANYVAECLGTLSQSDNQFVVVWDNHSAASDRAKLRSETSTRADVTLIESESNLGFGAAVNRAIASVVTAPDDILWILNPDTEVVGDAVQVLIGELDDASGPIILSPLLTYAEHEFGPDQIWFAGGQVDSIRGVSTHAEIGKSADRVGSEPFETSFMTGAALMTTASVWRSLGGFREDLFLYWEDTDLSIRAERAGIVKKVVPAAVVRHHEGGSSGSIRGRSTTFYYYSYRNRLLVCGDGLRGRISVLFGRGLRETLKLFAVLMVREKSGRPRKFLAAVRGVLDGIRGVTGQRGGR
jgi:N-acetylglucosaminyl-diphospho-decaprenol L-rhamnosyltransferase